jgi:hypothetical protein
MRAFAFAALAVLLIPQGSAAEPTACPDGRGTATLGIGLFQCRGGSCSIFSDPFEEKGEGAAHFFSVEPSVWQLDPEGPAARELRDGDVIVMVDDVLVTSRAGGRRLANLEEGVPVRLRIRRDGHEEDVTLVPQRGCDMPALTVTSQSRARERKSGGAPLDFGMAVLCGDCGWRKSSGRWVWVAREAMQVVDVARGGPAERAGLRVGDRIVSLQDDRLGDGSHEHLAGLEAGQEVRVGYERAGRRLEATLVPRRATGF